MKKTIFLAAYVAACGVAFANTDTLTLVRNLDEVVVNAPVAQVTNHHVVLKKEQINHSNTGQNLPYLLTTTPALIVTSDDVLSTSFVQARPKIVANVQNNIFFII